MSRNQHRWRRSLTPTQLEILDDGSESLKWAWKADLRHPKSYPENTQHAFDEIKLRLKGPSNQPRRRSRLPVPKVHSVRSLSDLINEPVVKAVYEDQNADSYEHAIRLAGDLFRKEGGKKWRKLLNAIDTARYVPLGIIPKPRIHFLHRNLVELAKLMGLADLNDDGIVEYLDDLCPCGRRHTTEAIRKFRQRMNPKIRKGAQE